MNRRSTDCLRPFALLARSTQEEMDGRQCSSRNELESTCGRLSAVIRFLAPPMPQHVPISSPFQVCFSAVGGAIYQNVSPLVSANGRRPAPISRARHSQGGRVPLSELRMQVTHRPTDGGQARNVFSATSFLRTTDVGWRGVSVTDAISDSYSPAWICSERRERAKRESEDLI